MAMYITMTRPMTNTSLMIIHSLPKHADVVIGLRVLLFFVIKTTTHATCNLSIASAIIVKLTMGEEIWHPQHSFMTTLM